MTHYADLTAAVQAAVRRVLNGDIGDRLIAGVVAFVNVILFHPASWLLYIALGLTAIDWLAGRQRAQAEGTYSPYRARGGINSKMLSWVVLLTIWMLTMVLIAVGQELGVAMDVTWLAPIYFTAKYIVEELKSIDVNLGSPPWLRPLIRFVDQLTRNLAPNGKPPQD